MKAMINREIENAEQMIAKNTDLNPNKKNKDGRTALMLLCSQDIPRYSYSGVSVEVSPQRLLQLAQLLLSKGADINMKDNNGYTAVMLAAENAHSLLFKHFMETNRVSDINESSYSFFGMGKTTLEIAEKSGKGDYSTDYYTQDFDYSTSKGLDERAMYVKRQSYIVQSLREALAPKPTADGNSKKKNRSPKRRK
jgi:ankyrin repeat protein